jgi:hypothetical protein
VLEDGPIKVQKQRQHYLTQILWYSTSSSMMDYVDPQLMTNLSATSVRVIRLSSRTRALTHLTLSAIREVVGWPERSSTTTLVLFANSTHWYDFLCVIQFSPYSVNFLLWISVGFTLSDHNNRKTARCSTMV